MGAKTLPATAYEFKIDRINNTVEVAGSKDFDATTPIVTTFAATPHDNVKDAHIVFDKAGNSYTISELWEPDAEGVLAYATKGKHEHRVLHVEM